MPCTYGQLPISLPIFPDHLPFFLSGSPCIPYNHIIVNTKRSCSIPTSDVFLRIRSPWFTSLLDSSRLGISPTSGHILSLKMMMGNESIR